MKYLFIAIFFCLSGCSHTPTALELEAKYAPSPSKFIDVNGTRIHYRDEGSGPTVVLIHGVLSSLHTWDGWAENLKKDHRVIRFDVPAFGLTGPFKKGDYNLENYLFVINEFLTKINAPKKFTMAGNSLGGYLAWNYSLLHPEKIEKVALIDSGAYPQELPKTLKLMIAPIVRSLPAWTTPEWLLKKNVESVYGDSSRLRPDTLKLYYEISLYPGNKEAAVKLFQNLEVLSKDEPVNLKKLKMPVLVMWGEKDTWIPFNPRWKQDLPTAKYIIYPGVGHIPMEEIPEQSVQDFRSWMNPQKTL